MLVNNKKITFHILSKSDANLYFTFIFSCVFSLKVLGIMFNLTNTSNLSKFYSLRHSIVGVMQVGPLQLHLLFIYTYRFDPNMYKSSLSSYL